MSEELMTLEEAAKILGVTPDRVVQYANSDVLKTVSVGDVPRHSIGLSRERRVTRKALDEFTQKYGAKPS